MPLKKASFYFLFTVILICLGVGCSFINNPNKKAIVKPWTEIPVFSIQNTKAVKSELIPSKATITPSNYLKMYDALDRKHYDVFRFTYPTAKVITESEEMVVGYYYKPKELIGKVPLILVFPILDGDHLVCEWQSKILANYGFAVIRFEKKKGFLKKDVVPEFHREILIQTIIDVRRALDWVCTWPEIDTTKIGVTGVSFGGITASLLMAADNRINAGAFFLFGGNLPKIVATTNEKNVVEYRERLTKNIPLSELENYLKPIYKDVDPLTYVNRFDPNKLLIISASRDKVILPSITLEMWLKLGKPPWIKLPFVGHFSAAVYFFYGNKRMVHFFQKQFNFNDS